MEQLLGVPISERVAEYQIPNQFDDIVDQLTNWDIEGDLDVDIGFG